MRNRSRLLLTGLAATIMLGAVVANASARKLAFSDDDIRIPWRVLRIDADTGGDIDCPVTLLASFHSRTVTKIVRSLIGAVTSSSVGTCSEGRATALTNTLPWHLTYLGFLGRLPLLDGIIWLIVGAAFQVETSGVTCLARTDTTEPAAVNVAVDPPRGQVISVEADPSFEIDVDDPDFLCDLAGDSRFAGTASVATPEGNLLFVRLIE